MTGIDGPVVVDWPTDGVCRLRLNNPERLNPLSGAMIAALRAGIETAERKAAGILVLAGAGRALCAGADLKRRPAHADAAKRAHNRPTAATAACLAAGPMPAVPSHARPHFGKGGIR